MDTAPAYLLWYFIRIRKHSGESGYLVSRVKGGNLVEATDELSMLWELRDLHFIALSEEDQDVVFQPLEFEPAPGIVVRRVGTQMTISVPNSFIVLARGRWYWTEILSRAAVWAITASVGAVIGGMVAAIL